MRSQEVDILYLESLCSDLLRATFLFLMVDCPTSYHKADLQGSCEHITVRWAIRYHTVQIHCCQAMCAICMVAAPNS